MNECLYTTHIYEWTSSFFSLHLIFFSSSREKRKALVCGGTQSKEMKRRLFFSFLPLNKLTAAQPMCTSVNLLYQKESLSYLFY